MRFLKLVLLSHLLCVIFWSQKISSLDNSTLSYDPSQLLTKIFNLNSTQGEQRAAFKFDDQSDGSSFISFEENKPLGSTVRFISEDFNTDPLYTNNDNAAQGYGLTFIENNRVHEGQQKKRRRRKPRLQRPQGPGSEYNGPYAPGVPQQRPPYFNPILGSIHNPPIRPRPSLATEALSSVTEALTSIALHDDKQCVARLLCEAASGGNLGSSQVLQSITGLQPFLTLLSAYSGISSNPLFVFGRAAFLGMSSKDNAASCRYAYPLCPTDPEQLVYYLNNHNGGFFRFFNNPQQQLHIDQLYQQLSQDHGSHQQFLQNVGVSGNSNQLYQQNQHQDYYGNYGFRFPHEQSKYGLLNNIRFKSNNEYTLNDTSRIEKRIQNRPEKYLQDFEDDLNFENFDYNSAKVSFPESNDHIQSNIRVSKGLKFPENNNDNVKEMKEPKRNQRGFIFPATYKNQYVEHYKYEAINPLTHNRYEYNDEYNKLNGDNYKYQYQYDKDQSIRTVYVVRGNGDPNHPEIIRLRPGQTVR